MWCVDVILPGARERYMVFDDGAEARLVAGYLRRYCSGCWVHLWKL